jgi:membrane protein
VNNDPNNGMLKGKRRSTLPAKARNHHLWRIIRGAWITFTKSTGAEASASLAYYTIFSIFPLLLVIVGVASYLTDPALVEQDLILFFDQFFPVSQDFIRANIQQIFDSRGTLTIISLVTLIWSSTAVFSTLIRNVNSAWPSAAPQSFIRMKLNSIGIVLILTLLMIISSFSVTIKNLLISLGLPIDTELLGAFLSSKFMTQYFPILIRLAVLYLLYYYVPQIHVKKKAALIGASFGTLAWQVVTFAFGSYMRVGMARYEIIYGSLGKIIALLAWTYFTGYIILFCAHLTSAIDRHTE